MQLSPEDAKLFYRLYFSLLFFVNEQFKFLKEPKSPEDLKDVNIQHKIQLRDKLYENPDLIDVFVQQNPYNMSPSDLEIIEGWNDFVKERLILFRYLKNYTIFLDTKNPPIAYGVLGTYYPLRELIEKKPPIMMDVALLPFKGQIVCDGILSYYKLTLGGFLGGNYEESYRKAKFRTGIITSLPVPEVPEKSDEDRLRFYLKNKQNYKTYIQEIEGLVEKNPGLLKLYHHETGKLNARSYRKELRKVGVRQGWYAVLEGVIIAGGESKGDVLKTVENIVPKEKREFVYVFQLK